MDRTSRASARLAQQQQREAKQREQAERRAYGESERAAQRAVTSYVRAEEQKRRASRASAQVREKAEKESTAIAAAEARKRGLTAEQEARVRQTALEKLTKTYETAERRQTAIAKREQRARDRETTRAGSRIASVAGRVASVGASAATTAHAQIQDARRERAQGERTLRYAVSNAGGSESDVSAARERVRRFVEETGISFADVSAGLKTGQERGSALEAAPGETRAQALERSLSVIRMANAEGADPGQLLAARGRLGQAGLSGEHLDRALRMTMGAAQRGSVEVDQIIQQGLPGATRLMTQRVGQLGPNATAAQRQEAALTAYRESVALQEVGASTGRRAGNTANVLAGLNAALQSPRRQEAILNNIQTAESQLNTATPEGRERAARLRSLRESMFERDPTRVGGAMRMREGRSPLEFAARLTEATGGDASAAANILAGTGHGNPQSLLANMRDMVSFLGGRTASGQTGGQRVVDMMSADLSPASIAAHQAGVEGDSLSQLTRAQEKGANALTDNTNQLVQLSTAFATWAAAHPLEATGMSAAGTLLAGTVGSSLLSRVGTAIAGTRVAQMLGLGAEGAAGSGALTAIGAKLTGTVGAAGSAATAAGVAGAAVVGGGIGYGINRAMGHNQQSDNPFSGAFYTEFVRAVRDAVRDGVSSAPITATVAAVDAAQSSARAPAPGR